MFLVRTTWVSRGTILPLYDFAKRGLAVLDKFCSMPSCLTRTIILFCSFAALLTCSAALAQAVQDVSIGKNTLSRPARPWEFLDAVGPHSSLLGNESGEFEAWVYPLKIFSDFQVTFIADGRRYPSASVVRMLTVRPEGPTLSFASDSFTVNETWLASTAENGCVVRFEISTWEPLEIEASFARDFQLMWPAGLGGTYLSWDEHLRAFTFGEEGRTFAAIVGSPSATAAEPEYFSNTHENPRSTFHLKAVTKGTAVQ